MDPDELYRANLAHITERAPAIPREEASRIAWRHTEDMRKSKARLTGLYGGFFLLWRRSILIPGKPEAMGSKSSRAWIDRGTGKAKSSLFEADHGGYARWRLVAQAALELGKPPEPWRGAVVVSITDTFTRPLSHYVGGKRDGLLKKDAPLRPVKLGGSNKPDWDKSARATCDNLKLGGWIADDGLVVEGSLSQEYAPEPCKLIQVCGVMNGPGEIEQFEQGEYAAYDGSCRPTPEEIERQILLIKARNGEAARAKRRGKRERAGTRLKARRGAEKP
jgi:hypothetical protein